MLPGRGRGFRSETGEITRWGLRAGIGSALGMSDLHILTLHELP